MQCFDFNKFLLTLQKSDLNESCLWKFACGIGTHCGIQCLHSINIHTERMHFNVNFGRPSKDIECEPLWTEYSIKTSCIQLVSLPHTHIHQHAKLAHSIVYKPMIMIKHHSNLGLHHQWTHPCSLIINFVLAKSCSSLRKNHLFNYFWQLQVLLFKRPFTCLLKLRSKSLLN